MDKNILKKFAIESRKELMEKVFNKIKRFYVDEEFNVNQKGEVYVLINDKHTLSLSEREFENRQLLIKRIQEITLEQVIEEAAYTWFNRIIAIRYMELHNYIPLTKDNQSLGIRVLSSKENTPDPEILKFTNLMNPDLDINFEKDKYEEFKDDNERYNYVLLLICKKLGRVISQVFDGITDYIDILIPDNLLNESGYITKLLNSIPEDNFNNVEIIGWLYQYYNQLEKDRVMALEEPYTKNEIPYATQLFTPDWIVKYMIENSLGKMWVEQSDNTEISKDWKYYIKDSNLKREKIKDITQIKFIDPCCGSGHVLVYAFEIFFNMYVEQGFNKNNIPELILRNNLYGIDIDDRAGQLSILSVMLKAREYDKDIFNKNILSELNILSIPESDTIKESDVEYLKNNENKNTAKELIKEFKNAKEFGSLLTMQENDYTELIAELENNETMFLIGFKKKMLPIIKCAQILGKKYDVVVTNPPYMSSKGMSSTLKKFVEKEYKEGKSDLFAAFILKGLDMLKHNGYLGMITMQSLMCLSSYTELRKKILENSICSFMQIGFNSFPELNSQVAHAISFVILKNYASQIEGQYYDLNVGKVKADKEEVFLEKINKEYYKNKSTDLLYLPNYIFAYWLSDRQKDILKNSEKMNNKMEIKQGLATGKNEVYIRNWFEVEYKKIEFDATDIQDFHNKGKLYAPYNKGGKFRKWYGNKESVIKFDQKSYNELLSLGNHLPSREYYFRKGITWSLIGNEKFAARISDGGFVFDVGGSSGFPKEADIEFLMAFLCSKMAINFLKALNPTINFQVGDIKNLPVSDVTKEEKDKIIKLARENISISKEDWDFFETSWDFKKHPLLEYKSDISHNKELKKNEYRIKDIYDLWESNCNERFALLKKNEEELNRIFIDVYKLQEELTPDVQEKDITIRKADKQRDIKSLISYAVGCMLGRYSLDEEGLIYAGGKFDKSRYKTFEVDVDNIIPITENEYFGDDIVTRFKRFIEVVYGEENLYENLDFIAEALGKKNGENSEATIRRYFVNDFYNDHIKVYQKNPIYWLFDSGKKNGFKCLIYMHRYNEGTVSKIRLDYLHKMQNNYERILKEITDKLNNEESLSDKRELARKQIDISSKLQEVNEYDEKIAHIADKKINIDLDDGVVSNYAKFSVKNIKTGEEESILSNTKEVLKKKK